MISKRTLLQTCVLAAVLASAGCAAPQRLATPSGSPEVLVEGAGKKQVADRLAGTLVGMGFQVRAANDYQLTFGKPVDSPMLQSLYGSQFNRVPELRHEYALVDVPGGIRVLGHAKIVTNPGSGFEKTEDLTQALGADMQVGLERLAASFKR